MPRTLVRAQDGRGHIIQPSSSLERLLRPCCMHRTQLWQHNKHLIQRKNNSGRRYVSAAQQQDPSEEVQPSQASISRPDCPSGYRIRSATLEEADQIAALNAEVSCPALLHNKRYLNMFVLCTIAWLTKHAVVHTGLCMA